jgi:hypothetical protein
MVPGLSPSASVTATCLAGLSLASWIDSEIAPRLGDWPTCSRTRLARILASSKCSLPVTVIEEITLSRTSSLTAPPASSCSGTDTSTVL